MLTKAAKTGGKHPCKPGPQGKVTQLGHQVVLQIGDLEASLAPKLRGTPATTSRMQKLILGQNQNSKRVKSAKALGITDWYCDIMGNTVVNGKSVDISATSNTVTVTVLPQQR